MLLSKYKVFVLIWIFILSLFILYMAEFQWLGSYKHSEVTLILENHKDCVFKSDDNFGEDGDIKYLIANITPWKIQVEIFNRNMQSENVKNFIQNNSKFNIYEDYIQEKQGKSKLIFVDFKNNINSCLRIPINCEVRIENSLVLDLIVLAKVISGIFTFLILSILYYARKK